MTSQPAAASLATTGLSVAQRSFWRAVIRRSGARLDEGRGVWLVEATIAEMTAHAGLGSRGTAQRHWEATCGLGAARMEGRLRIVDAAAVGPIAVEDLEPTRPERPGGGEEPPTELGGPVLDAVLALADLAASMPSGVDRDAVAARCATLARRCARVAHPEPDVARPVAQPAHRSEEDSSSDLAEQGERPRDELRDQVARPSRKDRTEADVAALLEPVLQLGPVHHLADVVAVAVAAYDDDTVAAAAVEAADRARSGEVAKPVGWLVKCARTESGPFAPAPEQAEVPEPFEDDLPFAATDPAPMSTLPPPPDANQRAAADRALAEARVGLSRAGR